MSDCPVCSGSAAEWRVVGDHAIDRCGACGFGFVHPRPSREEIARYYLEGGGFCGVEAETLEDVLERERAYPNSTVDAARIVGWIEERVPAGGRVLDVGCGYGLFAREAAQRGFDVDTIEVAPAERAIAAELLGQEPFAGEFEEFPAEPASYDAIVWSQILEHVIDVNEWVAKAYRLLRPDGVVCIAVPNFASLVRRVLRERDPYVTPPEHLNYFARNSLRLLLERHGFVVVVETTVSRLRPDVVSRRVPEPVAPAVARVARPAQRAMTRGMDRTGLGLFLNVVARRPARTPG